MEISSDPRTLRQILNSFFFVIPRFQRPYSWTRENVEELWEDAIQEGGNDYFIGSMVVYPHRNDTVAVIDGQQRLTTLFMFLCALRDEADKAGANSLANGTHTFIERKDENDKERFVLKTESSYPFLQDEVFSRGEAELDAEVGREEVSIQEAFERTVEFVEGITTSIDEDTTIADRRKAAVKNERLKTVRDKILNLRLILIQVGDQDNATTIFVTLNSRGKDLEPADLVKAHLLNLLPKKGGLDRPLERWDAMIEKFDQSQVDLNMSAFLHAVWRSRYESVTAANLAKSIRSTVKKANAKTFLKELETDAEIYRQVMEPDYRSWTKAQRDARESLYFFGNFQIRQPMPLLLALMRAFDQDLISISQLKRALKAIEDYHFAYNVLASKTSYGGMSFFYAKRARDLLNASKKAARSKVIDDLVAELKTKRATDAEFDEAFTDLWLTNDVTADRRVVRYILRRFYMHHKPKAAVDFTKMTVEHLSPQSKAGEQVGRMGNLILVDETANNDLANKTFPKKRAVLKKLDQWVPKEILDAKSWGESKITARTASMAAEARDKIWSG